MYVFLVIGYVLCFVPMFLAAWITPKDLYDTKKFVRPNTYWIKLKDLYDTKKE